MSQGFGRSLILLIGIPASGKSSLAAGFQQAGCAVVSTDAIRAEIFGDAVIQGDWGLIWQAVEQKLRSAAAQAEHRDSSTSDLRRGVIAVYDATNTRRAARRAVIRLARRIGYNRIVGLWLNPPVAICLARNQQRPRRVPEAVIQRMHRQLWSTPPKLREGFDLLLHYGGAAPRPPENWLL